MSDEEQIKLLGTVNLIARDIATPEQIQQAATKYRQFSSLDSALNELMMDTFNAYRQNNTMINYYLQYMKNKFNMDFLNIAEMEQAIKERLAKNIKLGNKNLDQNHQLVKSTLVNLCNRLNALGVDSPSTKMTYSFSLIPFIFCSPYKHNGLSLCKYLNFLFP